MATGDIAMIAKVDDQQHHHQWLLVRRRTGATLKKLVVNGTAGAQT